MERHFLELHLKTWQHVERAGDLVARRLQAAAEQGDPAAIHDFGEWLQWCPSTMGSGTLACYRWYKRAANLGYKPSLFRLSEFFAWPTFDIPDGDPEAGPTEAYRAAITAAFRDQAEAYGLPCPPDLDPLSAASDALFEQLVDERQKGDDRYRLRRVDGAFPVEPYLPRETPEERRRQMLEHNAPIYEEQRPKDLAREAERLVAAQAGDAEAMFALAWERLVGREVPRCLRTARHWFEHAAALGHGAACNMLGDLAQFGIGVERSHQAARVFYERALDGGFALAHVGLGALAEHDRERPADWETALRHYRLGHEACERALDANEAPMSGYFWGGADARLLLARCLERAPAPWGDPGEAVRLYQVSIGSVHQRFRSGFMFEHGVGAQADPVQAIVEYVQGARLFDYGYPDPYEREAWFRIGGMYLHGRGLTPDPGIAADMFEAADLAPSLFLAARMRLLGLGVEAAPDRALMLFRRAADHQVADACGHLGFLDLLPLNADGRALLRRAGGHLAAAAADGYAPAAGDHAWLVQRGHVEEPTPGFVATWLARAAAAGDVTAAAMLAREADPGDRPPDLQRYLAAAEAAHAALADGPDIRLVGPRQLRLTPLLGEPDSYADARLDLLAILDTYGLASYDLDTWLLTLGVDGAHEFVGR